MKKVIVSVIFLIYFTLGSFAQDIVNDDFIVTHGPYLQNLNSSGVTIIWTTNKPAIPGVSLTSPDGAKRFIRNSHEGKIDGGGTFHKVRIEGLIPGENYQYNVNSVQVLKYQLQDILWRYTCKKSRKFYNSFRQIRKSQFYSCK